MSMIAMDVVMDKKHVNLINLLLHLSNINSINEAAGLSEKLCSTKHLHLNGSVDLM